MSFSQMMPGDVFPVMVQEGHTETWQVEDVQHMDDTVDIKFRLLRSHVQVDQSVEKRRQDLIKPHRKIRLDIPDEWRK